MSDFDPIKAYREEIEGVAKLALTNARQVRRAAEELAHAEEIYNALLKQDAFMRGVLASMHERLRVMESEAEQKAKGAG